MIKKTPWQDRIQALQTTTTLALWRWREQWILWLVTGLGTLLAMILICSLPLFSSVMVTAGLRSTLRTLGGSTRLNAEVSLDSLTSGSFQRALAQVNGQLLHKDVGPYLDKAAPLSPQIASSGWGISGSSYNVTLYGASMNESAAHLRNLQGRLPGNGGGDGTLEVVLTQSAATYMGVHPGSTVTLLGPLGVYPLDVMSQQEPEIHNIRITLHVVGIVQTLADDPYWHLRTFEEPPPSRGGAVPFFALTESSSLLHFFDAVAQQYQKPDTYLGNHSTLYLSYALAPVQIDSNNLADLIASLSILQADSAHLSEKDNNGAITSPFIVYTSLTGPTLSGPSSPDVLVTYQNEVKVGQATLLILSLQIAGLLLFFMSTLARALIDRQSSALALLRSRGGSRLQIFGIFLAQGLALCLLADLLAPILAFVIIRFCAPFFLSPESRDALDVLPANAFRLFAYVGPYLLAALLVTLGTLLLSFFIALRANIHTLRREAARSTRRPLWQQMRLDFVLALLALAGYVFVWYNQNTSEMFDARTQQLLLTPLDLFAALLLLLAGLLFFLRLFPLLLRLTSRLTRRQRGTATQLAVAQMERSPRQAMSMALLLGLSVIFIIFTLIFAASQTRRAQDLSAYQAGADFAGSLPMPSQEGSTLSLTDVQRQYQALAGVQAVSVGYSAQGFIQVNPGSPSSFVRSLQLRAVDPQTFASVADWSSQDSSQTLADLMKRLLATRDRAHQEAAVPAILSRSAWEILGLHTGETFSILDPSGGRDPLHYLAVAEVDHLPPANESVESGMLVDVQSLFYAAQKQSVPLQPNYIWLRTSDDPASLQHLRQVLSTTPLGLGDLKDQRAIARLAATNPLALNLLVLLSLGVLVAIFLALLANLLLPILSLRARLTSFAFLRALGAPPGSIARQLLWEQGLVLLMALVLGVLFGLPFAILTVPSLVVSSVSLLSLQAQQVNTAYTLQQLLPVSLVWPPSLLLALLALVLICGLALFLLTRIALQPALSQQLRLNED